MNFDANIMRKVGRYEATAVMIPRKIISAKPFQNSNGSYLALAVHNRVMHRNKHKHNNKLQTLPK